MLVMLWQDLSLFVNEVKRDNEMIHSLNMVQKRYVVSVFSIFVCMLKDLHQEQCQLSG